jgi:hypothetical protein
MVSPLHIEQDREDLMKTHVAAIGLALLSPALASAMTVECRDLTFGQRSDKLFVALDQGRASVSSATGQLLGSYSFEILRENVDSVVLLARQSALPWPSPVLILSIDLEGTKPWTHQGDLIEGYRIAGAIEWICRRVE